MSADFYGLNTVRPYPIADGADCTLPPGVLADASISFPPSLGRYAYLSALSIDDKAVRIVISACWMPAVPRIGDSAPPGVPAATPILKGLFLKPDRATALSHVPLQLDPLVDGAGGWIVLGRLLDGPFKYYSSGPHQSQFSLRCCWVAPDPGYITSVAIGTGDPRPGVIDLSGRGDLSLSVGNVDPDGEGLRPVILGRLAGYTREMLIRYAGSRFGGRPDADSCDRPAIEALEGVGPDCDGNINVFVHGADLYLDARGYGGFAVDYRKSLAKICNALSTQHEDAEAAIEEDEWIDTVLVVNPELAPPVPPLSYDPPPYNGSPVGGPDDPNAAGLDPYNDPRLIIPEALTILEGGQLQWGDCFLPRKLIVIWYPGSVNFGIFNGSAIELTLRTSVFGGVESPSETVRGVEVPVRPGHPLSWWSDCLPASGQHRECADRDPQSHAYQSTRAFVRYFNYTTCAPRASVGFIRHWLGECERGCADNCGCGTDDCGEPVASLFEDCTTAYEFAVKAFGALPNVQGFERWDDDDELMYRGELIT